MLGSPVEPKPHGRGDSFGHNMIRFPSAVKTRSLKGDLTSESLAQC